MEKLLPYLNSIYPLSVELKEHLAGILKTRTLSKKDFLLRAGHISEHICFIETGLLKCFYLDDAGTEVCSWFMKEGDVIVSVKSFFTQQKSYEFIEAIEPCRIWYITYAELQHVYRTYLEFNYIGRVLTEQYYTMAEDRLYGIRMKKSHERLEYLQQHHSELLLRVPAKDIASFLGLSPETLSRARSAML